MLLDISYKNSGDLEESNKRKIQVSQICLTSLTSDCYGNFERNSESEATAGEGDFGRFPEQKNSAAAGFYYFLSILSSDFLCLGSLYQWKDLPGYITVCGGTPFIQSRTEKNPKSAEDLTLLSHIEKIILC